MSSKKLTSKNEGIKNPQSRIKELEKENTTLKNRLEELRKAKLQTIIKHEGHTIPKSPNLGRKISITSSDNSPSPETNIVIQNDPKLEERIQKYKSRVSDLEKEAAKLKEKQKLEISAVKTEVFQDMRSLRDTHVSEIAKLSGEYNRDLDSKMEQIQKFRDGYLSDTSSNVDGYKHTIKKLEAENLALREQNQLQATQLISLESRIGESLNELSEKEATWCELEEKLKIQIQKSWGEKYQAWMVATEKKIEELRQTNEFLKTALERQSTAE